MRWASGLPLAVLLVAGIAVCAIALRSADVYLVSPRTTVFHFWLPLFAALLAAAGLLVRSWRATLTMILISAAFGVALAEAYLAMQRPALSKERLNAEAAAAGAHARGQAADRRLLGEVLADLGKRGVDAYPTGSPTGFLLEAGDPNNWQPPLRLGGQPVLPLTGIAAATSVYCNESGQWLIYRSDRYGFKNPDTVWDGDALSVALIGDSFAQGACVAGEGESPADRLREHFPQTATLGVAGTGPLLQLAVLKEYGPVKRPKDVFWLFYEGNDIHTNLNLEGRFPWLLQYLRPEFEIGVAEARKEIDAYLRTRVRSMSFDEKPTSERPSHEWLLRAMRLLELRERLGLLACPRRSQDFALLSSVFGEAKRIVEGWGGALTVVYIPAAKGQSCDLFELPSRKSNWLYDESLAAMEKNGLPVIDLKAAYNALGRPESFYYFPGSHFSAEGYRFLADAILRHLGSARTAR